MLDLEKLFRLHAQGKLTLDQKVAVLESFGIKIPRREIARSLIDLVGAPARRAGVDQVTAMGAVTKEQIAEAAHKVVDSYLHQARVLLRTDLTQRAVIQEIMDERGVSEADAKQIERETLYLWKTMGDEDVCPQCDERGKMKPRRMREWRALGLPGRGTTYCGRRCRCWLAVA